MIDSPKVASAWHALERHYGEVAPLHLRGLFADDPERARRFSAEGVGLFLDYSKNRITDETLRLLFQLARPEAWRSGATRCFAATRSTSRKGARCFTSR